MEYAKKNYARRVENGTLQRAIREYYTSSYSRGSAYLIMC